MSYEPMRDLPLVNIEKNLPVFLEQLEEMASTSGLDPIAVSLYTDYIHKMIQDLEDSKEKIEEIELINGDYEFEIFTLTSDKELLEERLHDLSTKFEKILQEKDEIIEKLKNQIGRP